MIELEINDKVYEMASEWSEVLFSQMMEFQHVENDKHLEKSGRTYKDAKLISRLCMKPEQRDELFAFMEDNFVMDDFRAVLNLFEWANSENLLKFKESIESDDDVIIDGEKYNFKDTWGKTTMKEQNAFEMQLQHNKNLTPEEIAFGVYFRKIKSNDYEDYTPDVFERNLTTLVEKVKYCDVIKRIELFFSGDKNSSPNNTKGYSLKISQPKDSQKKKSKESEKTKKQKQAQDSLVGDGLPSGKK